MKNEDDHPVITVTISSRAVLVVAIAAVGIAFTGWTIVNGSRGTTFGAEPGAGLSGPQPGGTLPAAQVVRISGDPGNTDPTDPVPLPQIIDGMRIIFFGTTTCPYCAASVPALESLAAALPQRTSIQVVLLDATSESVGPVALWARSAGVPVVAPASLQEAGRLGIRSVPTTVLVTPTGTISHVWSGQLTSGSVEEIVRAAEADTSEARADR